MIGVLRLQSGAGTLLVYPEVDPGTGELIHLVMVAAQGYQEQEVARAVASFLVHASGDTDAWMAGPGPMLTKALAQVEPITVQGGLLLSCAVCIRKGQMVETAFAGDIEVRLARMHKTEWFEGSRSQESGLTTATFGIAADDVLVITTQALMDEMTAEELAKTVLVADPPEAVNRVERRLQNATFRDPQAIILASFRKNLPAMGEPGSPAKVFPGLFGISQPRRHFPKIALPVGLAAVVVAILFVIFGTNLFREPGPGEPGMVRERETDRQPVETTKIPAAEPETTVIELPPAVQPPTDSVARIPAAVTEPDEQEPLGKPGELLWKVRIGGSNFSSSPCVAGKKIYVGSKDTHLYCLSTSSGEVVWKYKTDGGIGSSPLIVDDRLCFGSYDSTLYCINRHSGELLWKQKVNNRIATSPEARHGMVFCGSDDHSLYAWKLSTGAPVWNRETGDVIWARPVILDEQLFIGSLDGLFYCLHPKTGEIQWSQEAGGKVYASAALAGRKTVLYASAAGHIRRVTRDSGDLIWQSNFGSIYSTPVFFEDLIYFGSKDGLFHCLAADKGNQIWSFSTTRAIRSSPVISGNTVYVGGYDGRLYALNRDTGKKRWEFDTKSRIYSTPVVSGGRVFFGDLTGWFYALAASS